MFNKTYTYLQEFSLFLFVLYHHHHHPNLKSFSSERDNLRRVEEEEYVTPTHGILCTLHITR